MSDTRNRAGREAEDLTALYRLYNNAPGSARLSAGNAAALRKQKERPE